MPNMRSTLLRTSSRLFRPCTSCNAAHIRFISASSIRPIETVPVSGPDSVPPTLPSRSSSYAETSIGIRANSESAGNDAVQSERPREKEISFKSRLHPNDPAERAIHHPAAAIILRDACKCSKCKDHNTSQRNFHIADIPIDIKATFAEQDAQGKWIVRWENDIPGWKDHVSTFSPHEIQRLKAYMKEEYHISTRPWDKKEFEKDRFTITYDEYMSSDVALAKTLFYFVRHGLVMIKDVPEDESSVAKLARRIAAIKSTFYGETWDVKSVPNAVNVAYTSKYLGFHADLMYIKEPPTAQFLHCIHNSCVGGESRFVDQFRALDTFYSEDPELARVLARTSLRYEYENNGNYYTDTKPIVQFRRDTYTFPRRQIQGIKNIHMNHIYRVFWSPPFLGSIASEFGVSAATLKQSLAAMKKYTEILERPEFVFEEKMIPGTCVLFDNLRVLHARNEFDMNTGKRWLRGAYLDGQDMWSLEMRFKDQMQKFEQEVRQKPKSQSSRYWPR